MRAVWRLVLGMALVGAGACGPGDPAPEITMELDAFSGRPNPTWLLSPEEAAEVVERLRGLPRTTDSLPPAVLGYRGFALTGPAGGAFPGRVYVGSGLVAMGDRERPEMYRDTARLEELLLEMARARGYEPRP